MANTWARSKEFMDRIRESRKLKLSIVFLALFVDNLLFTVVVPIMPSYLLVLDAENDAMLIKDTQDGETRNETTRAAILLNVSRPVFENGSYFSNHFGKESYMNENSKVGWLLSSKAIIQLLANPFIGPLTNRYGYNIPMFVGSVVLMASSILYACGESYTILFLARAIQGIGSSCIAIAGMSMLAHIYPDDKERSKAMGIALGGTALGVLVGYPLGGVMYQFVGEMQPFIFIAILVLIEGVIQFWVLQPSLKLQPSAPGTPLTVLLKDPYIIIAAGAILFPEMAMAMLEPTLPIWLIETMQPDSWQLGVVFIPDSVGFWLGCNVFGIASVRLGRWIVTMVAMVLLGICLICIPFATKIVHLIVPHFGLGLALGMVDAAMMPLLALLVDTRHVAVYGSVYAIAQIAINLGFAIGPSVGGQTVKIVGFAWLMRGIAIVNIIYTPLCYFLRDPPAKNQDSIVISKDEQANYKSCVEEESFSYQKLQED